MSASLDGLVGRTLAGKYRLEERLRAGAMGAIYRAHHVTLDKAVCIKVMHPELAKDPLFAERFYREARAASRFDHPCSIMILDHGAEGDVLYIAMELVEGRDLADLIEEAAHQPGGVPAAFPPRRIVDLLAQTLAALGAAHDVGILHRDLKPENIMVAPTWDDDGAGERVKVCDFGIAHIDDLPSQSGRRLTMKGFLLGTPEYMSPEQARAESVDARSDVYAAGVVLYLLLTGRLPFEDDSAVAVALMQINAPPPAPSALAPQCHRVLERICLKALEKDPTNRFATARAMRAALRDALAAPTTPRRASAPFAPGPATEEGATWGPAAPGAASLGAVASSGVASRGAVAPAVASGIASRGAVASLEAAPPGAVASRGAVARLGAVASPGAVASSGIASRGAVVSMEAVASSDVVSPGEGSFVPVVASLRSRSSLTCVVAPLPPLRGSRRVVGAGLTLAAVAVLVLGGVKIAKTSRRESVNVTAALTVAPDTPVVAPPVALSVASKEPEAPPRTAPVAAAPRSAPVPAPAPKAPEVMTRPVSIVAAPRPAAVHAIAAKPRASTPAPVVHPPTAPETPVLVRPEPIPAPPPSAPPAPVAPSPASPFPLAPPSPAPPAPVAPSSPAPPAPVAPSSPAPPSPDPPSSPAVPPAPVAPSPAVPPAPVAPSSPAPVAPSLAVPPAPVVPSSPALSAPVTAAPASSSASARAFSLERARVDLGTPVVTGATSASVERAIVPVKSRIDLCYRAALSRAASPVEGAATLHLETDDVGNVRRANVTGALASTDVATCIAKAVTGRRIANVDTGHATAAIPLTYRAR
ncbi:MAG: protein kinase [Labilithrix sp.]|nr:protein kinase [Labilithrix sp.]MCW5815861.1 protein kinase [Labilithrix sp.]